MSGCTLFIFYADCYVGNINLVTKTYQSGMCHVSAKYIHVWGQIGRVSNGGQQQKPSNGIVW